MKYIPDYQLNILTDEEFESGIKKITEKIEKCRVSGFFDSYDGKKNFYEYFLAQDSKASVIIVHGLSEFTKKYYEVTDYFLNQGYNVFLFDQRCHGFSTRLTDRIDLIHVDSFKDYTKDLSVFIDEIVLPADKKPLYIYSHSMGGAVTALYLSKNSDKIKKAILSAPLIEPYVNMVSPPIARVGVGFCRLFQGGKTKFKYSKEFDPEYKFEKAIDESRSRFVHNITMRKQEPNYQSTPMTLGWVYNSLVVHRSILKSSAVKGIKTPILLISAENDTVVRTDMHHKFAKKCKTCRLVSIKNTDHAMLTGSQRVIAEHLNLVFSFFAD